ncbi:hypothetical protein ACJMK2_012708 [Sinanodonta woodiana]|uniref:RAP domain-containing protein n=1 Tax=Sinanodonta woodiana TaxID=1069815 RepID=A0ABD3VC41_SINWO
MLARMFHGRGIRYVYRIAKFRHTINSITIDPSACFKKDPSLRYAHLYWNLFVDSHIGFRTFSTTSKWLAASQHLDKMVKEQNGVSTMLQTLGEKFPVENLDPVAAVDCLKIIRTFMYNKMLCKNAIFQNQPPIITFAKVFQYQNDSDIFRLFFPNPYFQGLLNQICGHISQFAPAHNAELFACLVTLGISLEHPIMQELISLFLDEKYPMCLNDLATVFDHVKVTPLRSDLFFLRVCMPRLQKSFETNIVMENTRCSLERVATLLEPFSLIQCSKMRDWYQKRLLSMAEDNSCMNLDSVRSIMIMLSKSNSRSWSLPNMVRLTDLCFKEIEKSLHKLKPYQIEVIAQVGWQFGVYKSLKVTTCALDILEKVHFMALNMLEKVQASATLTEILTLLLGVRWQKLNINERESFERLLAKHIEEANIDDLLKVVNFTQFHRVKNKTCQCVVDAKIIENIGKIMNDSKAFRQISNYYRSFSASLPLHNTLLDHMQKSQMFFETKEFVYLAQLILCTSPEDKPFSKLVIDKVESMISQFRLSKITVLLRGLDVLNRSKYTQAQILDLHILLDKAFVQKIETTELLELCDVAYKLGFFEHTKIRHAEKINLLYEKMAKLVMSMKTDELYRFALSVRKTKLYNKVVLDSLAQYLIRHGEALIGQVFVLIVVVIAKSGYQLQEHSVFTKLCLEITQKHFDKLDIQEQISLAHSLCLLQICPQEILCRIFSFEYLMALDKYRVQTGWDLNFTTMHLNRCAVLEYPQLNIPWFHESFDAKFYLPDFAMVNQFTGLFKTLSEILGGPEFFEKNVLTPYFHPIAVELFLDENKRPVSYAKAKQAQTRTYQPIAILLATKFNDENLNGFLQTEIRQLEILGYKVVVILYSEWNSMAMFDNDERVKYLKEKLFTV